MCRNSIVDKLVEECTKVVHGDKIYNETLNATSSSDCASCTLYVVLFAVFLTSIIIGSSFVYFQLKKNKPLDFKKNVSKVRFNPGTTHRLIY